MLIFHNQPKNKLQISKQLMHNDDKKPRMKTIIARPLKVLTELEMLIQSRDLRDRESS